MATPIGHAIPGSFFTIFAIWWGFCISIKHFHSCHSTKKSRKLVPYHATTTFSCSCCPSPSLRQIPLESYIKLICVSIGMLGEGLTGLKHNYDDTLKRKVWKFREIDTQHVTLYSSFAVASLIEIFVHAKYNLPKGIEFIANAFAFGVEAFLFHFHVHGQDDINIHVHTLLVYSICFCILAALWEFNRPNQILASYCRTAATLFQGFWLYAAGFILYFPSDDPYWRWTPNHESILLLTVLFIWLALFACIFLFIQSALIWSILKRRYGDLNHYSVLSNDDKDEEDDNETNDKSNNHQLKSLITNNGNTIVHLDDDENDSQIEFEQSPQYSSKILK